VIDRDDQQTGVAPESSADAGEIAWPCHALARVAVELDLDHDGEHRLAIEQEHDKIRAQLARKDIREIGRLDAHLGEVWEVDPERIAEEASGELRAVPE